MPWEKALDEHGSVKIDQLAKDFQQDQQNTPFSNSFFFNVEQRFASLQSKTKQGELELGEGFTLEIMSQLIAAEYLNSGVNQRGSKINLETAKQRVARLLDQCFSVRRIVENNQQRFEQQQQLNPNALHLIRFLAQKGVEHGQA